MTVLKTAIPDMAGYYLFMIFCLLNFMSDNLKK